MHSKLVLARECRLHVLPLPYERPATLSCSCRSLGGNDNPHDVPQKVSPRIKNAGQLRKPQVGCLWGGWGWGVGGSGGLTGHSHRHKVLESSPKDLTLVADTRILAQWNSGFPPAVQ